MLILERWARVVTRHRTLVVACWAGLVVAGLFCGARLPALLSTSLSVPGTSSARANAVLSAHFAQDVEGTFTVVLREGRPPEDLDRLDRELARAARVVPTGHASALQRGVGVLYGNVGTSLGLDGAAPYTGELRRALAQDGLPGAYVTGAPAVQYDISPVLGHDLRVGEAVAVVASLVLLLLAFGLSPAVLLPFAMALGTTSAALAVLYGLAHETLMVLYVPNLVDLIGLGLAVDYSLLIIHRFREESEDGGRPVEDAVASTLATAGRTVLVSGVVVALGLFVVTLVPVPFVRSLGLAGCVVPVMSVLAALTLLPACLSFLGRRGTRGLALRRYVERRPAGRPGIWQRLAEVATSRPWAVVAGSTALLALAALPAAWLALTPASVTAIPQGMPSARGLDLLRSRVGPGAVSPLEIVVDAGRPGAALSPAVSSATERLARELTGQPDVFVVAIGTRPPYVDPSGRYRQSVVVERDDFGAEASQRLVRLTADRLVPEAHFPTSAHVYLGGAPVQGTEFLDRIYSLFAWVALLIGALSYVVLVGALRSVLLPLMAMALDACTVIASYGVVVLLFRSGAGAGLLGLYHVSQIEGWVPVFLLAMLFGLSMDYEVFFVTRMRESWDATTDNAAAIVEGLSRTGRVVSVAALIMVGALLGLVGGQVAGLQELGVGLAFGVLVDATVVRGLLMPSLMVLAGEANWWLPAPLARLLHAEAPRRGARSGGAPGEPADLTSLP